MHLAVQDVLRNLSFAGPLALSPCCCRSLLGRAGHNQTIRVNELKREKLLDSLGLNQTQLQQLAGLLGNDHIKHISKEKIAQLKEAHPNEHVVAVLAKQVLELQPSLAAISPAAAAAAAATAKKVAAAKVAAAERAAIDPAVRSTVAAAVASVVATAEPQAGDEKPAAAALAANGIEPEVKQLVAAAVRRAAAADAGSDEEEEEEEEHHDEDHHEDEQHQEEDHHEEEAAAAAGSSSAAAAAANTTDMLVDRCRRSMLQYGPADVKPPGVVGNGDRWLLSNKGILMRGVGLEDMSMTPCHVLLQPLRLAVYASMGLSSVTEYMCVPDEKWKEWAAGRVVNVPPVQSASTSKKAHKQRRKDKAEVHPAVKKLVAAAVANVLAAAGEEPAAAAAAEPTEAPAAADEALAAADAPAAAAAEEAAGSEEDGVHPAVKKLVATAVANVVAKAAKESRRASSFDPLPKTLPQRPQEVATFITKRLRALDPAAEQLSRRHEQLLLLQVRPRAAVACRSCPCVWQDLCPSHCATACWILNACAEGLQYVPQVTVA